MKSRIQVHGVLSSLIASAALLAACGGGGDAPPSATGPKAEGVYEGTLTGSTSTRFQMLVLENDEFWALYGVPVGNVFGVRGFIQGQGVSSNGSFTSSNAKDFGFVTPVSGTVAATYVANASVSGSVSFAGGTVTFNGAPIPIANYNYNTAAVLSDVTGAWTLGALDGSIVSFNIAGTGSFTGISGGCAMTGTMSPRLSGKNVFDVTVTFGGAPCAMANTTGSGIAVSYVTNVGSRQIVIAGVNAGRTAGTALFGTR